MNNKLFVYIMKKGFMTNGIYVIIIFLLIGIIATQRLPRKLPRRPFQQIQSHKPIQFIPINISTRGVEDYRQIGILNDNNGKVLPLYGRPTYTGSSKWNYFTQANDHLALKIPLTIKGKECEGTTGCDEIYDHDSINVSSYGNDFQAQMYNTTPKYIPFV